MYLRTCVYSSVGANNVLMVLTIKKEKGKKKSKDDINFILPLSRC